MHKEMESSMFFSIFQLMQFMKYQGMKRMEELDIKPSQAGILFSLKCWGEQSQRQLAQRVGITPPSMTVALRKMEEKGYVKRIKGTWRKETESCIFRRKAGTSAGRYEYQLQTALCMSSGNGQKMYRKKRHPGKHCICSVGCRTDSCRGSGKGSDN